MACSLGLPSNPFPSIKNLCGAAPPHSRPIPPFDPPPLCYYTSP